MSDKEPRLIRGLTALTTEDYQALLRERDELRTEVERLTVDNQRLTEMWDTDREALTAEVERLRVQASADKEWIAGCHRTLKEKDAEVERLTLRIESLEAHSNGRLCPVCDPEQ